MHERTMNSPFLIALQSGLVLASGALLVVSIVLITSTAPALRFLFEAHTFGPLSEEVFKIGAAYALIRYLRLPIGSIPLLGLGFGLLEGVRHFQVYGSIGLGAIAAHITLGIVMTALLYCAVRARTIVPMGIYYALALCVPAALHLFYNVSIVPHLS